MNSRLEWRTIDDDETWEQLVSSHPVPSTHQPGRQRFVLRRRHLRIAGALLSILLFVAVGAWRLEQLAADGLTLIESDLNTMIELELATAAHMESIPAGELIDEAAPRDWQGWFTREWLWQRRLARDADQELRLHIGDIQQLGDVARVDLTIERVADSGPSMIFNQTRFYRRTDDNWRRTAPDPRFWGEVKTLESEHFRFHYRARDRGAVTVAANLLDLWYAEAWHALGLAERTIRPRITVEVGFEAAPRTALVRDLRRGQITIPSPQLLPITAGTTDAEVIRQLVEIQVGGTLVDVVMEVQADQRPEAASRLLADALHLHLIWRNEGPLAVDKTESIRWMVGSLPAMRNADWLPQREDYDRICTHLQTWALYPAAVPTPFYCDSTIDSPSALWLPLAELRTLGKPALIGERPQPGASHGPRDILSLALLFEYVEAEIGQDGLRTFITNFGLGRDWETIIRDLFVMEVGEFETNWHAYLTEQAEIGD